MNYVKAIFPGETWNTIRGRLFESKIPGFAIFREDGFLIANYTTLENAEFFLKRKHKEPEHVADITKSLEQTFQRMLSTMREVRNKLEAEAKKMPSSIACETHQLVQPIDWEESVKVSHREGKSIVIYGKCPKCARNADMLAKSEWLISRGVPRNMGHAAFSTWDIANDKDRDNLDTVKKFADKKHGFLILQGQSMGSGKSHLAVSVMRHKEMGRFVTHSCLMSKVSEHYDNKHAPNIEALCQNSKLLVLDDVGISRGGSDEIPTLHRILDARYGERLPTIITTNLTKEEMDVIIGKRMAERLKECCYARLVLEGKSKRPERRNWYFED